VTGGSIRNVEAREDSENETIGPKDKKELAGSSDNKCQTGTGEGRRNGLGLLHRFKDLGGKAARPREEPSKEKDGLRHGHSICEKGRRRAWRVSTREGAVN